MSKASLNSTVPLLDVENYLSLSKNEAPHLGPERQPFLIKENLRQDQLPDLPYLMTVIQTVKKINGVNG